MRWFTSDWHLNHLNIIDFANRPFNKPAIEHFAMGDAEVTIPDVDAMNKALIDNFNDLVDVNDEAWFIGDVAMGSRTVSVPMIKQLKCRNLFLVPGNHDNCHKMYKHWRKSVPLYEDAGFTILESDTPGPVITTQIAGVDVLVCHFPYTGDSQFEDRYSGLRPDDDGSTWLLHGHVHAPWATNDAYPRQIHVGVDAWDMKPVSEDTIAEIIAGG